MPAARTRASTAPMATSTQALGHEVADEAARGRAQRQPHGELAAPRLSVRTSSRLTTLMQAIRSSSAAPPSSSHRTAGCRRR